MFCKYCGEAIPDDSNFCVYCSKKIKNNVVEVVGKPKEVISAEITPAVENHESPGSGTEKKIGDEEKECVFCGAKMNEDAKFCPICMRKISHEADTKPLSKEELDKRLNISLNLIRARMRLASELKDLKAELDAAYYVMPKHQFLQKHPEKYSNLLHKGSEYSLPIAGSVVIMWLFFAIIGGGGDNHYSYFLLIHDDYSDVLSVILYIGLFFLAAVVVCGIIGEVRETGFYNQYRSDCAATLREKTPEYNKKAEELNRIEKMLNDPEFCVISRPYWKSAEIIAAYVQSGAAGTIAEAITKFGIAPTNL